MTGYLSFLAHALADFRCQELPMLRKQKPAGTPPLTGSNVGVDVRVYGDSAVVLVTSSWLADGKRVGDPYQATHVCSYSSTINDRCWPAASFFVGITHRNLTLHTTC
jgi:hypothetical protein